MQIFEEILFSKATNNAKANKSLIYCQLGFCRKKCTRDPRLAGGSVHDTQSRTHFLQQELKWQRINELFVFVLFVALKKRIPSKMCILSCFG